jgi:cold shock CspA family protein
VPSGGGKDAFVNVSTVHHPGFGDLVDGTKLAFEVVENRGGQAAENLTAKCERRPHIASVPLATSELSDVGSHAGFP